MTLISEIIAIQNLKSGEAVGYGGGFRADRAMRIGVVACGYADGYPRLAPTGTPVLVEGEWVTTAGRVSMDMLCIDLVKFRKHASAVRWNCGVRDCRWTKWRVTRVRLVMNCYVRSRRACR